VTDKGLLYPQLHDIHVDFGDSELYMDSPFKQFFYRQGFHLVKYIVMDAINRFGKSMYNDVFPDYFHAVTNN
jgi:hypothetical protein